MCSFELALEVVRSDSSTLKGWLDRISFHSGPFSFLFAILSSSIHILESRLDTKKGNKMRPNDRGIEGKEKGSLKSFINRL